MLKKIHALRRATRPLLNFVLLSVVYGLFSCDRQLHQLTDHHTTVMDIGTVAPLVHVSYEVETYTGSVFKENASVDSKEFEFKKIAGQPLVDRKSIDIQIFEDGSYQMTTEPRMPSKLDLMSITHRNSFETLPYGKTVVNNGLARYYDKDGVELGQYKLDAFPFRDLLDQLRSERPETGALAVEVGARMAGRPMVHKETIMKNAKKNQSEVSEENGITKIKSDMGKIASTLKGDNRYYHGKMAEQHYDFGKERMIQSSLYDKSTNRLLSKSNLVYAPVERGNQLAKIITESYEIDSETGLEITHYTYEHFFDLKVESTL